ncbi:MAG: hypothetical protein ABIP21_01790 [Acidimicrobiia bacterium]
MRFVATVAINEPARGLRQATHSEDEQRRRNDADHKHDAPGFVMGERFVDEVGGEDADRDRELVDRDE